MRLFVARVSNQVLLIGATLQTSTRQASTLLPQSSVGASGFDV